jgi:signal transduction histidine kinase
VVVACGLLMLGAWQLRALQVQRQFSLILGERARVAREIHDTLLQSLVGVAFQFDAASIELDESPSVAKTRLARLRTQIELAIKEARQSIWDLRSPTLERRALPAALREVGESIVGGGVRFELAVNGAPRPNTPRLDEAVLRIGREAISNAVRHARATYVHVQLSYDNDAVTLRVTDDGRGFGSATPQVADHWGLATMRERAEQLGGRLRLASSPGQGTEVEFIAPLAKGQNA